MRSYVTDWLYLLHFVRNNARDTTLRHNTPSIIGSFKMRWLRELRAIEITEREILVTEYMYLCNLDERVEFINSSKPKSKEN